MKNHQNTTFICWLANTSETDAE